MATGWKRWVELGLARGGPAHMAMLRRRRDVAILAYHNVVPAGESVVGDRSLHVDQKTFAAQLDWIRRRAEVVPLSKIYHAASESRLRVVITFDDAYRGTMTAGLAELGERGMPATVFVPTGLLGGDGFWWDRLASGSGPLDPGVRNYVMNQLQGDGDRAVAWAREQGVSVVDVPAHARPVTEEELLSARMPGLTLGAHTVTHANLPSLGADAIRSEMTASKDWLKSRTDRYIDALAYPYGHHDDAVVRAASDVFEHALLVDGGLMGHGEMAATHRIPRINMSRGLGLDGLFLRLAGLIG